MSNFIDFEAAAAADDNGIVDNEPAAAASSDIDDFIDDETQIDDNLEDYYVFTKVSRSVEDAMQDSFLDLDSGKSLTTTTTEEEEGVLKRVITAVIITIPLRMKLMNLDIPLDGFENCAWILFSLWKV